MSDPIRDNLSQEESDIINSVPAVLANYFFTTHSPLGVRLTFAEQNPGSEKVQARGAVYIEAGSLDALISLLENTKKKILAGDKK